MCKLRHLALLAVAWVCLNTGQANAAITPASLFTDNAVLQREKPIPVWGTADPNEKVTVSLNGATVQTTATSSGEWKLKLPGQAAGGPYTLSIAGSSGPAVTLQNILVGEVWLCSGQSNMEYPLTGMNPAAPSKATIPTVSDPQLRFVIVARTLAQTPQARVGAQWKIASPETVAPLSAVAYYFARDLRKALNVPVGIVESAFGGTFGQNWMSREALASQPLLEHYIDEEAAYATTTYPQLLAEYQAKLPEYQKKYDAEKTAYDAAVAAGNKPSYRPSLKAGPQTPDKWQAAPMRLFNGMIAPLIPYAIRGAVWYQGEGNWNKGYEYHTLLPSLIADWRGRWNQGDFPFLVVQLPPYGDVNPLPERSWFAEVREAQRLAVLRTPNSALVVTTDVGDQKDIHPFRKEPVGQRLALAARVVAYHEKIEASGPVFESIVTEGNQLRVKFSHADGLRTTQITDHTDDGPVVAAADKVMGFTIAGADNKFYKATGKIEGSTVLLSAPEVPSPVAVRYGWSQFPLSNLQNSAGLFASPFRTDNDRLISQPRDTGEGTAVGTPPSQNAKTTAVEAPKSLVANGDFTAPLAGSWTVLGHPKGEPRIVPAQIDRVKPPTRALQLELAAPVGANPWDVVLQAPATAVPIARGNTVGMHFWAKSSQATQLNAVYQQGAPGFQKIIRQVVKLSPEWQECTFFATAQSELEAGKSNFELQLGQATGTVEIAGIRVANLGAIDGAEAARRLAALAEVPAPLSAVTPSAASPAAGPVVLRPRKAPPYIVLKLDDVGSTGKGGVPPRWQKLVDFIRQRRIKAALGIITNSLEGDKPEYFQWLKDQQASGLIEFWDHGYTHKEWDENGQHFWEFKGRSYEEQKEHLMRSQALAREKIGISFAAFGAGFNQTDDNTAKAISEIPELKVWMYGDPKNAGGKVMLERPPWLGIENPIFVPSLNRFVRPYNNVADAELMVIQGHPGMWDDARFAEFVKIMDFLSEQKAIFVTPSEYAALKHLTP